MSKWLRTLAAGTFVVMLFVFPGILLSALGTFVWEEYGVAALAPAAAGSLLVAWVIRQRRRASARSLGDGPTGLHRGIRAHSIPIAGGVGLLITIGYVVMFWFGAPGYRPLVLGVAGAGGLLGLVLIRRARSRPQRDDTSILHLGLEAEPPESADRLQSGREDARFTSARWRAQLAPGRVASSSV